MAVGLISLADVLVAQGDCSTASEDFQLKIRPLPMGRVGVDGSLTPSW